MENFKIDKTFFKAQTFEEANLANIFAKDISAEDRLRMAFHLSCPIYGIKEGDSLKLDKTIFLAQKLKDA